MPRTKASTESVFEPEHTVITKDQSMTQTVGPMECHCGATRYIYGKSMDAFNVTIVYKCPDCGSTETVIEKLE